MFIQKISIIIKTKVNKDKLYDEFNLLLSYYRGNGQTQGNIESQYIKRNKIVSLPYTLEKKSLSKKYNNKYVQDQIDKIEKLSGSRISIKNLGKTSSEYKKPCICCKSEFYILITNYISIHSPLTCGTCNKSVPLYKLPKFYDFGYMPILSWETNYQACDSLQMNCEVGERWSLNQMQETKSPLSKQGLDICKQIEEQTTIPTFYHLYNYRKNSGDDKNRLCPNCKKKWTLKTQLHNLYDFKCDNCRIISTISTNT
nr:DUF2310 family Zn-ribbon-containing protein [uncultured Sphingobacterium sp.]